MAATFNAGAAASWLIKNSFSESQHQCAKFVRMAIEAGGISTAGRPVAAQDYAYFLPTIGFNVIPPPNPARVGDLCVISHGTYGHICMFCGNQWISDFKQPSFMVYHEGVRGYWFFRFNGQINGGVAGGYDAASINGGYFASSDVEIVKSDLDKIFVPQLAYIKNMIYRSWVEQYGIDSEYIQTNDKKDSYSYLNTSYNNLAYYTNLAWKENYENAESYTAYLQEAQLAKQGSYLDLDYSISDLIVQYFKLGRMGNEINTFGDFGADMGNFASIMAGGFGGISVNGISFMIANEGWSDGRKRANLGTPGTDAVAVSQGIDKGKCVTVGPGLTNLAVVAGKHLPIRAGQLYSAQQIMAMYAGVLQESAKQALRANPRLKSLGQAVFDMAIDCLHSGIGHFKNAGWYTVSSPQEAAQACMRMVTGGYAGLKNRRIAEACICLGKQATGGAKHLTDAYYHPDPKIAALVKGK